MSDAATETERRLREEEIAWPTTVRADGQLQSVPVWFFGAERLFCSTLNRVDRNCETLAGTLESI